MVKVGRVAALCCCLKIQIQVRCQEGWPPTQNLEDSNIRESQPKEREIVN